MPALSKRQPQLAADYGHNHCKVAKIWTLMDHWQRPQASTTTYAHNASNIYTVRVLPVLINRPATYVHTYTYWEAHAAQRAVIILGFPDQTSQS